MIIVMEKDASDVAIAAVEAKIRANGLEVHVSRGTERTLIGAIGDERKLDPEMFDTMDGVEKSMHIVKPYKLVAREWHKANTVINAGGIPIGGKTVQVIAGPCSVETSSQMHAAAEGARAGGARLMRGGAFKPRTSPYAFQGKGIEGLKLLKDAAASCKLPVVTELMDARMLDAFLEHGVDVIQIGTRNMQNFDLLKAVGQVTTPVILSPSATSRSMPVLNLNCTPSFAASLASACVNMWQSPVSSCGKRSPPTNLTVEAASPGSAPMQPARSSTSRMPRMILCSRSIG